MTGSGVSAIAFPLLRTGFNLRYCLQKIPVDRARLSVDQDAIALIFEFRFGLGLHGGNHDEAFDDVLPQPLGGPDAELRAAVDFTR